LPTDHKIDSRSDDVIIYTFAPLPPKIMLTNQFMMQHFCDEF